jgi:hypothetical protein
MEMSLHPNDISVRSVYMSVPWQLSMRFLAELIMRDVRNWGFFEPLLQLQADKPLV